MVEQAPRVVAGSKYGSASQKRPFQPTDNRPDDGAVEDCTTQRKLLNAILAIHMPTARDPGNERAPGAEIGKNGKSVAGHREVSATAIHHALPRRGGKVMRKFEFRQPSPNGMGFVTIKCLS